jgi:hypothetical protein
MKTIKYITALVVLSCAACTHVETRMNNLSLGMTKPEVISLMGSPAATKATEGVEILEYAEDRIDRGGLNVYWLFLRDGKLVQYGKAGDFGSTAPRPAPTVILNLRSSASH